MTLVFAGLLPAAGRIRAFTEAKNFAIVNALYLSPSIDGAVQSVVRALASFSAEIQFHEPGRYKQREDLAGCNRLSARGVEGKYANRAPRPIDQLAGAGTRR
jgi:hypothetical protein